MQPRRAGCVSRLIHREIVQPRAVGLVPRATDDVVPEDVLALVAALDAARAARDFAVADTLRATLQSEGWVVETTKEGTLVRKA